MSSHVIKTKQRKRMAIIASYFGGETYGLLGPQMAATVIQDNTAYDCIVITVTREDDKTLLKKALINYFGVERPIVGFSALSGREDLFRFARELKDDGAFTLLAGPQANVDYLGERNWQDHPHRFKGLSRHFTFSLHGPAEQVVFLLQDLDGNSRHGTSGLLYCRQDGKIIQNPKKAWDEKFLRKVQWDNIYRMGKDGLIPLKITTGQVLQHIGCPYSAKERMVEIDYPASLTGKKTQRIKLPLKGCSFCDVAVDKGFYGALDMETVIRQIHCLPGRADGRKIPFELINENPLPGLPRLLTEIRTRGIRPSRINLILRADWFVMGERYLRESLVLARDMGIFIRLGSVGFESFDDGILRNFNKGLSVETNLRAIRLMRRLKEQFPRQWAYARVDGAIHGFIHPTPWDTRDVSAKLQKTLGAYALPADILPEHSTPLIIHHASGLGDWIREIERRENIRYKRYGSVIGWWREGNDR